MTGPMQESYLVRGESAPRQRIVQYFDKSRMEITYPEGDTSSQWYVSNGLLAKELISGQMQTGDDTFVTRKPAAVNVAGDADDTTGPTYEVFFWLQGEPALPERTLITQRIDQSFMMSEEPALASRGVAAGHFVPETNHTVAVPFWDFMNSSGTIWDGSGTSTALRFADPFYATGLPISEAYWSTVKVGGQPRDILVQCFERRCLTYTPDNPAAWQVEAGNVGQHDYAWRYGDSSKSPEDPPEESTVILRTDMGGWAQSGDSFGSVGEHNAAGDAYMIDTAPHASLYAYDPVPYSDASYSVNVTATTPALANGEGCLVFRESKGVGTYHMCLTLNNGVATGTHAFYVDVAKSGAIFELGTVAFDAPVSPARWFTLKVFARGQQF